MGVSLEPRYKSFAHTKANLWNKGLKKLNRKKWAALKRNRGNDNSQTLLKIPLRKMFAYKLESKQALKKYYGKILMQWQMRYTSKLTAARRLPPIN